MKKGRERARPTPAQAVAEAPRGGAPGGDSRQAWALGALLALGTLAIYWQSRGFAFLNFDDPQYVRDNPVVSRGLSWEGLRWAFTTYAAGNWHPLAWISHMLDVTLFGVAAGPHHLVNAVLHALNALLLFLVLRKLTGAGLLAAAAAALFAFHPLRVESVAWVSERKDLLCALFWLLAMLFYAGWAREGRRALLALSTSAFALALLSKPMAVTFPLAMLLLDVWPLERLTFDRSFPARLRPLILEKLPMFALLPFSFYFTIQAQRGAMSSTEAVPLGMRLMNAAVSYVTYVGKTILPVRLAPMVPYADVAAWKAGGALLLLMGLTAGAVALRRRAPALLVGWLWFLGTLVPAIGLVQVGQQALADRYTYLPSIGLVLAVVWGAAQLLGPSRVRAVAGAAAAASLLLGVTAVVQASRWRDSVTLFTHATEVTEANAPAWEILAGAQLQEGNLAAASASAEKAVAINPASAAALQVLSRISMMNGDVDRAVALRQKAAQLKPDDYEYAAALAVALNKANRKPEAAAAYRRAIETAASDPAASYAIPMLKGELLLVEDKVPEAIPLLEQSVANYPNDADLRNDLGAALARLSRDADAAEQYEEALRLRPSFYDAMMNYGALLGRTGRNEQAAEQFRNAAAALPTALEPKIYLALVAANSGRLGEALEQARSAYAADPVKSNELLTTALHLAPAPDNMQRLIATLEQRRR